MNQFVSILYLFFSKFRVLSALANLLSTSKSLKALLTYLSPNSLVTLVVGLNNSLATLVVAPRFLAPSVGGLSNSTRSLVVVLPRRLFVIKKTRIDFKE